MGDFVGKVAGSESIGWMMPSRSRVFRAFGEAIERCELVTRIFSEIEVLTIFGRLLIR